MATALPQRVRGGETVEVLLLILVAILPVAAMLWFIYRKDKFEREPLPLVLRTLLAGALAVIPTLLVGHFLAAPLGASLGLTDDTFGGKVYTAFVTAGLVEEVMKFLAFYLVIWHNPNFNEPFDAIVYCVAASLGFAAVENILYVLEHGLATGVMRAVLAVPGHAIFGVAIGYYMGLVKFGPRRLQAYHFLMAFVTSVGLHGVYDVIAFNQDNILFVAAMYAAVAYMWVFALRKMERAQSFSPFQPARVDLAVAGSPCPSCGALYPAGANYCHLCGRPLARVAPAE
jgi:protease PrsW